MTLFSRYTPRTKREWVAYVVAYFLVIGLIETLISFVEPTATSIPSAIISIAGAAAAFCWYRGVSWIVCLPAVIICAGLAIWLMTRDEIGRSILQSLWDPS